MQRTIIGFLLFAGFSLIIFSTAILQAQDDDDPAQAEYYGEDDCSDCHRDFARAHEETYHGLALQEAEEPDEDEPNPLLADFSTGEDVRTVTFPGEDEPRPFDEDDIVYILGAGRHAQRYVTETEDGALLVLPAEWITAEGEWRPFDLGEDWAEGGAYDFLTQCAGCHVTGLDLDEGEWIDDGVQCESCHGPGSVHVDRADDAGNRPEPEELDGIRAAITVSPDAQTCGRCHSQGTATESGHPVWLGFRPGFDDLTDGFELVPEDDPVHWWASGHASQANMQYNEWLTSAHSTALESMQGSDFAQEACLTCHSVDYTFAQERIARFEAEELEGMPPEPVDLDNAEHGVTCTSCHSMHFAPEDAEFFLRDEPYALCTGCHTDPDASDNVHHPVQQMFEGQTLLDDVGGFPSAHFSAEDGPECITCHMPDVPADGIRLTSHTFSLLEPGEAEAEQLPDSCGQCHQSLAGSDLQALIDDTQTATQARIETVMASIEAAEAMELDEDGQAALDEAVAALRIVRGDSSRGVHNFTYADRLLDHAEDTLAALSPEEASAEPSPTPAEVAAAPAEADDEPERVESGYQPITWVIMALTVVVLVVSALAFFRSRQQEV